MPYRRDIAVQTLLNVTAELRASWAALPVDVQQALARLIDEGGHDLYRQNPPNRATACVRLLDKIAALPDLPVPVITALAAGAGISTVISVNVDDEQRDAVLAALCQVYDPRRYRDPWSLATEMHQQISQASAQLDPETRRQWEEIDSAGGDPAKYLDQLGPLLGAKLPFVLHALDEGKTWEPLHLSAAKPPLAAMRKDPFASDDGGGAGATAGAALETVGDGDATADAASNGVPRPGPLQLVPSAPARVPRSANVYFPSTLQLAQKMVPLIVHIAREAAQGTITVEQGSSAVNLVVGDLIISVLAPDFDVDLAIGGVEIPGVPYLRRVKVDPSSDSEPVIFFLSPSEGCEAGSKRISIEFLQNNKRQGSLAFDVAVVEEPAPAAQLGNAVTTGFVIATRGATAGQQIDVPDLDLRVGLQGNVLTYSLLSADGRYQEKKLGQTTLVQGDPRAYFASITDRLSTLAAQSPDDESGDPEQRKKDEERNVAQLQALGVRLWDELISQELSQVYDTDLRSNYAGKSLVITSDEPWIPWEMVRPVKRQGGQTLYIDPPLCEQFRLTRWLDGQAPPDQLQVKRGVIIAPEDNLQFVQEELDYFKPLAWTVPLHTLDEVNQEFDQGSAQLFHFSCHGRAGTGGSDEATLKLGDEFLAPSDVLGRAVKLYECTPLVFLNACEAGQPGFTLTGLGGWARAFIKLQASIFIGSLWAINDKLAAEFAESFYNRLWGLNGQQQQSVGEAFHAARQDIKAMAPGNPTWLAYVLYGDPNGRVYIVA